MKYEEYLEFEELMASPMLWKRERERLIHLARQFGVSIVFYRRQLDDWDDGWRVHDVA